MTVLRRFDCVLASTKAKVLAEYKKWKGGKLDGDALDPARMYQIKGELDASGIYLGEEVERFVAVYFKSRHSPVAVSSSTARMRLVGRLASFASA